MDEESAQTPAAATPEPEPAIHHGPSLPWLAWLFVALLLYVLSIGPVAKACDHYHLPVKHPQAQKVLETIYRPLTILAANWQPATRLLVWYLRVWRVPVQ